MKKVVVFLGDGFEEIEALTVVDVLRRGEIDCITCSLKDSLVRGAHDIYVMADKTIDELHSEEYDAIVLPGGMPGAKNLKEEERVIEIVKEFNEKNKLICAICAAPMVLGYVGILNGVKATCYPGFEEYLKGAEVLEEKVVVDKNIITSRGPATAIHFALEILKGLKGEEIAMGHKESMMVNFVEAYKE